jgi:hypothetical protein
MSVETSHPPVETEERLRFETLIAELSLTFVNLQAAAVDHQIMDAQRRICELLGLDFAALWQWSPESSGHFTLTHFYSALSAAQDPMHMREDQYPWARDQLLAGRTIAVSSPEELPPEAACDRETLRRFGIKSNLALPLSVGGEPLVGILGLGTLRVHRDWPDAIVKRLQLLAQIFANALARKRTELMLRESAERLSLTTDAAEVGLWILDCHTRVFWATERARAMFGFSPDEAITMERFRASVHPDDWQRVQGSLERSIQGGEPVNLDYRIRLNDERTRWITSRGRPAFTPAGSPQRLMGVSLDITEGKLADEARRASEARLEAGSDLVGLGYYEVDYGGHACFLDERFRQICGVPAEIGGGLEPVRFWQEHVHPDDRQAVADLRQKLHDGLVDRISIEYRYLHPAQGQRWLHHSARFAGRAAGASGIRTFGVIRDITEQKLIAEEVGRMRLQLWHADRVAQTGAITASLAHELNQPLTGILSTAQAGLRFLASGNPDLALMNEILTNIVHDTKRAGAVINGLRAMLRRREGQREPIHLADTIRGVLDLAHSELIARQVECDADWPPAADLRVMADKAQIQQVLLNLVMNALEAMQNQPPEQRRLTLTFGQSNPGEAMVTVRDTGPGIPEDQQDKVFTAFWTTKHQGMGIGLAISYSIIESHGGRLYCANHPDGGATFHFTLPIAPTRGESPPVPGPDRPPEAP